MTSIVFSCVARGPATILCSHQDGHGDFEQTTYSMLRNIPTRNDAKTTYTTENYMYHVVVENGLIYICVAGNDFGRMQPYAFLEEVKRLFDGHGLTSRAQFAGFGELNQEFSNILAQKMEKYSQEGGGDQLSQLRRQVDDVKGVMTQNIEKVLERGENLDTLMNKTEDLEAHSATFKKTARQVHRKMWWKNTKMTLLLIGVVIVVITVITIIILFSTGVLPPKGDSGSTTPVTTAATTTTTMANLR